MAHRRVVVVGFHGGGPYYVEPLIASGRMPHWQCLAAGGLTATLQSTWPVAAGAWVTLLTGLEVAQHGVLDITEIDARRFPSGSSRSVDARVYSHETILALASNAGRSVSAISVPMTAPAFPVNGCIVPGVPVEDEVHPPTWPPDLRDRLGPISLCRATEVNARDPDHCRRYLDFDLERIVDVSCRMYRERDWDLFMTVFKVPDLANHLLCENPAVPEWRAMIDDYLVRTDAALGALTAIVDPDTVVIVLSDHGSRPRPPWRFRVASWLEAEGLLARRQSAVGGAAALDRVHRLYRRAVQSPVTQRMKSRIPSRIVERCRAIGHHWTFVDLDRSRVFPVDLFYPLVGFEVNLRGRQPRGVVAEADFDTVRDSVMRRVSALRRPDRATPLVRGVYRREELFDGPFADRLPDVIAELDHDFEADLHFGPDRFYDNPGHPSYPFRGYHAREGLLVMHGPGIPSRARPTDARVHDIMPTVMRLLDVAVPANRRGMAIPAAFAG